MPDIRVLLSRFQARARCIAGRRAWGGERRTSCKLRTIAQKSHYDPEEQVRLTQKGLVCCRSTRKREQGGGGTLPHRFAK